MCNSSEKGVKITTIYNNLKYKSNTTVVASVEVPLKLASDILSKVCFHQEVDNDIY